MLLGQRSGLQGQVNSLKYCLAPCLVACSFVISTPSYAGEGLRTLETDEIIRVFANVLDKAEVLDAAGVHAETYWYASGHFQTRWWSLSQEGRVNGRWMAQDNKRCVLFSEPTKSDDGAWRCGKILRQSTGAYLSLNPDGSAHGLHQLADLPFQPNQPLP